MESGSKPVPYLMRGQEWGDADYNGGMQTTMAYLPIGMEVQLRTSLEKHSTAVAGANVPVLLSKKPEETCVSPFPANAGPERL